MKYFFILLCTPFLLLSCQNDITTYIDKTIANDATASSDGETKGDDISADQNPADSDKIDGTEDKDSTQPDEEMPDAIVDKDQIQPDSEIADEDSDLDETTENDSPDNDEFTPCQMALPNHINISSPVWDKTDVNFYIPNVEWAFALLHATKILERIQTEQNDIKLSPSYFLATVLQESFMGCSENILPDPLDPSNIYDSQPSTFPSGCFQIEKEALWNDICTIYPDKIDCTKINYSTVVSSGTESTSGFDNFASSTSMTI